MFISSFTSDFWRGSSALLGETDRKALFILNFHFGNGLHCRDLQSAGFYGATVKTRENCLGLERKEFNVMAPCWHVQRLLNSSLTEPGLCQDPRQVVWDCEHTHDSHRMSKSKRRQPWWGQREGWLIPDTPLSEAGLRNTTFSWEPQWEHQLFNCREAFCTTDTCRSADAQSNLPDGIEKSQLPFFFPWQGFRRVEMKHFFQVKQYLFWHWGGFTPTWECGGLHTRVHVPLCLCEQEAGAGMGDGVILKILFSSQMPATSNAEKWVTWVTQWAESTVITCSR